MFPTPWKIARVFLIEKPRKSEEVVIYRPICMMKGIGKLFERIIAGRAVGELKGNKKLCA